MKKVKSIHFVGIKGVGMTPLAVIAKEAGIQVTGSDVADEFITDKTLQVKGITPKVGFTVENVGDVDLVITTGAHGGFFNPEVIAAKDRKIPVLTKGQAVGEYMKGEIFGRSFVGISVAGSHGKTTTSALIATLLQEEKLDPSYIIGTSEIPSLGVSGHFGKGKYFVAEADEYATEPKNDHTAQFLWQHPRIAVFTNIELDHPDIYPTVDEVRSVFLQFAKSLPNDGVLIACGDNQEIRKLLSEYEGRVITYGLSPQNDFVISRVHISGSQMFFWLENKGVSLGEWSLRVVGEHNALNATAAAIVGMELGLDMTHIKKGIRAFTGTKRRLEYIGRLTSGAEVFDDYAHHPTEIHNTLKALRGMYPKGKLHVFFQPHTYTRTKTLFHEFTNAFSQADYVYFLPIYASLRETPDQSVSSEHLAEQTKRMQRNVHHFAGSSDVVEYIGQSHFKNDSILIFMGAGDIYKITDQLSYSERPSLYG